LIKFYLTGDYLKLQEGLSFNDVMILPGELKYNLEEINLQAKLTRKIIINAPLMSAAVERVTEASMAIAIARQGGMGVIHKEMSIEDQATEIDKVKRSQHGVITDPFFLSPNNYIYEAEEIMSKYKISGVPVCENRKLVGIITNRDLKFENNKEKKIYELMTHENLITAPEGTNLDDAKKILAKNKIEKLPIVDANYKLKGLITTKDIDKLVKYPDASRDSGGRLLVGAAIGFDGDFLERAQELIKAKVDLLFLDNIYGYSKKFLKALKILKKHVAIEIIAGNIATAEATRELIDAGADGIKIGFGASCVSESNIIFGVGVPQLSAIFECSSVAREHDIAVISDGGIKNSGDITKALAAGANACMIGNLFENCSTSASVIKFNMAKKNIRLKDITRKLLTGLKSGTYYTGCKDIYELQESAKFIKITHAGLQESYAQCYNN